MNEIRLKRVYLPAEEDDGRRVLVDRLWPRGLSKDKARIDEWVKAVAPSSELRKWFGHEVARFPEFRERYEAELNGNDAARQLATAVGGWLGDGNVTLLFGAKDEAHNNAVVLKAWLDSAISGQSNLS